MNMRTTIVPLLVAASLLVTGCSTTPEAPAPTSPTSPTSSTTPPPRTTTTTTAAAPTATAKKLGEKAGVGGDGCVNSLASCMVQYTITKVSDCQGRGYHGDAPPAGTKRKLVWLEVQTGANYDPAIIYSGFILRFASANSAGVTTAEINPSTSWDCAPTGQNIGFGDQSWLPGKKYAGAVEVYLPTDAVKLVNGQGGWEWQIP